MALDFTDANNYGMGILNPKVDYNTFVYNSGYDPARLTQDQIRFFSTDYFNRYVPEWESYSNTWNSMYANRASQWTAYQSEQNASTAAAKAQAAAEAQKELRRSQGLDQTSDPMARRSRSRFGTRQLQIPMESQTSALSIPV